MAELLGTDEEAGLAGDGGAVAYALEHAGRRHGKRADDAVDGLLEDQRALITEQRHHLLAQSRTLALDHWSKRLRLALQAMTFAAGLLVVAGLAWMAIEASRADGVVIKPFTVAPDLAHRGVTGEVLASQLMDKLTGISVKSQSSAATGKFGAGWGQSLSLQIPETGVNLGEVDRWLREKLGHEHTLSGEVVQNPDGTVTLTARLGASPLPPQTGATGDLPQLLLRAAEALYRREQPMAYANYLSQFAGARNDELAEVAREMTDSHERHIRAYGYGMWGIAEDWRNDEAGAFRLFQSAIAENAGLSWPFYDLSLLAARRGRQEEVLRLDGLSRALIPKDPGYIPQAAREAVLFTEHDIALRLEDHATMLAKSMALSEGDNLGSVGSRASLKLNVASDRAAVHDGERAEADAAAIVARSPVDAKTQAQVLAEIARSRGHWTEYLTRLDAALTMRPIYPNSLADTANRTEALAKLGRVAEAHAVIDPTPLDCQPCIVARGILADAEGRRAESDHWFSEASRIGPSTPNGPLHWGHSLMKRGDAARATVQFREAVRRSPRADNALEGLGEALLAQGDTAGAVQQFTATQRLTPKWGRLHLKWGEALAKLGDAAAAKAQFRAAAGLDLAVTERAELAAQKA